jgi:hypothetical protein
VLQQARDRLDRANTHLTRAEHQLTRADTFNGRALHPAGVLRAESQLLITAAERLIGIRRSDLRRRLAPS